MVRDMTTIHVAPHRSPRSFPAGSGLALLGAALMIVGAWGPWVGGKLFGVTDGIDLRGDGWIVIGAAALAMLPLALPLPPSSVKGLWIVALAASAAYVCWIHYAQADVDGFEVVWGMELSALGSALLAVAGVRLLVRRA